MLASSSTKDEVILERREVVRAHGERVQASTRVGLCVSRCVCACVRETGTKQQARDRALSCTCALRCSFLGGSVCCLRERQHISLSDCRVCRSVSLLSIVVVVLDMCSESRLVGTGTSSPSQVVGSPRAPPTSIIALRECLVRNREHSRSDIYTFSSLKMTQAPFFLMWQT